MLPEQDLKPPRVFSPKNKVLVSMMIRKFQDSDFNVIAEIYSLSKLDELRFEEGWFELLPIQEDEKRLRELMESQIFVYDDDRILGYGAVHENEIRAIFVNPSHRGKGIGKSLLEFLIEKAWLPSKLYVAKSNTPAKNMYRKYGFTVTKEFETSYNGKVVLANEMVRVHICD